MRICIGTPDFTASPWYTYDDLPPGQKDPELKRFSIAKDREYVLPVLKAARRINPDLKFFASPWSPPAWMKTSDRIGGGRIDPAQFRSFAEYLARFIEAYREEGIEIYAITIQNEPEYAPETYPTCRWTAKEQRDFIRDHLGPVLKARKLSTLIWCFDHNFNNPGFPATILRDPLAAQYVDGSAFHHYEGKPAAMRCASLPPNSARSPRTSRFGTRTGRTFWWPSIRNRGPGISPCPATAAVSA